MMNDYKELIADLRNPNKVFYETFLNEESKYVESVVAYKAANAIEQLVTDYEILAKMYAKVNEDLCVITKERDAAVADLHLVANNCFEDYVFSACRCCKKNDTCNGQPATGCNFEWRGVKEDNDETD